MKLLKYRVRKFRSVQDSGWVTLDRVNALIGENESGKTNLLLPLWKLNPSSGGKIDLLEDAPRGEFVEVRETPDEDKPKFIEAIFETKSSERATLSEIAECDEAWFEEINFKRRYDGRYTISFPKANLVKTCDRSSILETVDEFAIKLDAHAAIKTDIRPKTIFLEKLALLKKQIEAADSKISVSILQGLINSIDSWDMTRVTKSGGLLELRRSYLSKLEATLETISQQSPNYNEEARKKGSS